MKADIGYITELSELKVTAMILLPCYIQHCELSIMQKNVVFDGPETISSCWSNAQLQDRNNIIWDERRDFFGCR